MKRRAQLGFSHLERLVLILLLGAIVVLGVYQYRAFKRSMQRTRINAFAVTIMPSSISYSCKSRTTLLKSIYKCPDLSLLSPEFAEKLAKLNYVIIADPNMKNKRLDPILYCHLTQKNTSLQVKFKAYKSFIARMMPQLCLAPKKKKPAKAKPKPKPKSNIEKMIQQLENLEPVVNLPAPKEKKSGPTLLEQILPSFDVTPIATSDKKSEPARKKIPTSQATKATLPNPQINLPPMVADNRSQLWLGVPYPIAANQFHQRIDLFVLKHLGYKQSLARKKRKIPPTDEPKPQALSPIPAKPKKLLEAPKLAPPVIPTLKIEPLPATASRAMVNHQKAKQALHVAAEQVAKANQMAMQLAVLASKTRKEAEQAINTVKPLFSILQFDRAAVREALNVAYYYQKRKNPRVKQQVLKAEKRRLAWQKVQVKFKVSLAKASAAITLLKQAANTAFEHRQQAATAARNAQIQSEIALRYAAEGTAKTELLAINQTVKFVMQKAQATELLYRQIIHQKSIASEEYAKYITGKVEAELSADESLLRLLRLWEKKLHLIPVKLPQSLEKTAK